jgi:hypothetical protein
MGKKPAQTEILQGTLDMLILQILAPGPRTGTPSPTLSSGVRKKFYW